MNPDNSLLETQDTRRSKVVSIAVAAARRAATSHAAYCVRRPMSPVDEPVLLGSVAVGQGATTQAFSRLRRHDQIGQTLLQLDVPERYAVLAAPVAQAQTSKPMQALFQALETHRVSVG